MPRPAPGPRPGPERIPNPHRGQVPAGPRLARCRSGPHRRRRRIRPARQGRRAPRRGGERRRPALGTPPDRATQKRVKTKKRELRGSGQVCRMAGEGARRAGNVPVRRIRCEWAPTPTEGPCEGICRGVAVEGPVGGVGGCEWAVVWLWIISSLNRESRGRVRWASGGLA